MSIPAGTRLGRYEIQHLLGAGGMGEVYRALDKELGRPVALKFLHAEVAADERRMNRFIQEARAASALNHPNILTVYDIGQTEEGRRFFATEFVDGVTLRERLRRGGMKLGEALEVASQAAGALAAAHAAGIVHRDIKPENIMLRGDGYAKVLDFGLAKLTGRSTSSVDTEAATRALVNTDPGAVMGTVAYMSPEQARGEEVDARTDIWSLGVVLYEMLTGHLPFGGKSTSHTIVSILDDEPPPLARYLPDAPESLQELVSDALAKDPEARFQTAKQFHAKLRRLKGRLDAGAHLDRSATPDPTGRPDSQPRVATGASADANARQTDSDARRTTARPADGGAPRTAAELSSAEFVAAKIRSHKKGFAVALAIAAVLVLAGVVKLIGVGFGLSYLFAGRANPPARFERVRLARITTEGNLQSVAVSPDGKYIAYTLLEAGKRSLWTKHLATDSRVQIVTPTDATVMTPFFFSHDGGYVFYGQQDERNPAGALFQVAVLGGTPKKILTDISSPAGLSPDGKRLAFARFRPGDASEQYQVWLADADGANERRLWACSEPKWLNLNGVAWSPDGKLLAVDYGSEEGGDHQTVGAIALADGAFKVVTPQRWHAVGRVAWFNDGSGMAVAATESMSGNWQIWQVSYPGGEARRVTNDLHNYGFTSLTLTADSRTLVALQVEGTANIWITPEGDARRARSVTSRQNAEDGNGGIDWAPDGRVVFTSNVGGARRIWVMNADGSDQKPLTEIGEDVAYPQVSPDGRHIFYTSRRSKTVQIWRMESDGSRPVQLTEGGGVDTFSLTPDGRWVVYDLYEPGVWKVPADGGAPTKLSDASVYGAEVSPDGKLLAYVAFDGQTTRQRLVVLRFDDLAPVKTFDLPVTAQSLFRWSPDSRALIYPDVQGGVSNLWRLPLDGSHPAQITDFKSDLINFFAYGRDGRALALSRGNIARDALMISEEK